MRNSFTYLLDFFSWILNCQEKNEDEIPERGFKNPKLLICGFYSDDTFFYRYRLPHPPSHSLPIFTKIILK